MRWQVSAHQHLPCTHLVKRSASLTVASIDINAPLDQHVHDINTCFPSRKHESSVAAAILHLRVKVYLQQELNRVLVPALSRVMQRIVAPFIHLPRDLLPHRFRENRAIASDRKRSHARKAAVASVLFLCLPAYCTDGEFLTGTHSLSTSFWISCVMPLAASPWRAVNPMAAEVCSEGSGGGNKK